MNNMNKWFITVVAGAASITLASGVWFPAAGQSIPRTADGKPDLRGRWAPPPREESASTNVIEEHEGGFGIQAGKSLISDPPDGKFPYQPWALAERNRRRLPENSYEDNEGKCIMSGVPRIMNFAFEIEYTPGKIIFFSDYVHHTRIFPLEQRPHLPSAIRLWMGDPVARWEGDTLVVESTNFNGKFWLDLSGDFISDAARIVERFWLADADTLKWEATITDPKVYTRPVTMAYPPYRRGSIEEMLEDACHEGNADVDNMKNIYDAAHGGAGQ